MLYFRDYHWLLVNGYSHFHAYIPSQKRVTWFLELRYEATGTEWRRVLHRPSVWMTISSFRPPAGSWRDLANTSFWELPAGDDWEEESPFGGRGFLDFSFYSRRPPKADLQISGLMSHLWRVAARDGRWFTVELAMLPDDYQPEELEKLPTMVTPDGQELEESGPNWKERAEVYLIENIPFGTVTVLTPRNARDYESYALARAQELIGDLGQPEHIQISEISEKGETDLRADIFVELHFHGHYER